MAWLRRTNENNVDLNRNFKIDGSYKGAPAGYTKLDSFLNPRTPPAFDFYLAKAVGLICRHGMSTLKQSVVGGQYEYPKGLFFGGKHLEEGPRKYVAFLNGHLSSAERCVAIEVHTGIGKYAQDLLFVQSEDFDHGSRTGSERGIPNRRRTGVDDLRYVCESSPDFFLPGVWNVQPYESPSCPSGRKSMASLRAWIHG
jgi:hypothetical protein